MEFTFNLSNISSKYYKFVNIFSKFMSGVVHTGVEVRRIDSEMSGLVEQP